MLVGFSTSGNSHNLIEAFAESRRRGMLSVGMAGYDGGQMARGGDVDHCFVVGAESIHRIQEAQAALGLSIVGARPRLRCPQRCDVSTPEPPSGREAAVLERIEAFRRRRPRLRDEVVTLAHGAGGKASASLIDSVFLDAFCGEARGALTDAAVPRHAVGGAAGDVDRFVRGQAPALPRGVDRSPRRARHGERPRRHGCHAAVVVRRLRPRKKAWPSTSCGRWWPTWPMLRSAPGCAW